MKAQELYNKIQNEWLASGAYTLDGEVLGGDQIRIILKALLHCTDDTPPNKQTYIRDNPHANIRTQIDYTECLPNGQTLQDFILERLPNTKDKQQITKVKQLIYMYAHDKWPHMDSHTLQKKIRSTVHSTIYAIRHGKVKKKTTLEDDGVELTELDEGKVGFMEAGV